MHLFQTDSLGSSVDPEGDGEPMVVQEPDNEKHLTGAQKTDDDKRIKDDNMDKESSTSAAPPPKRWQSSLRLLYTSALLSLMFIRSNFLICVDLLLLSRPPSNRNIAASDRLTIYFHAVLSKDFKFDPKEDRIFIRAGGSIGNWEKNLVELDCTR